jgi:hypothetical protein
VKQTYEKTKPNIAKDFDNKVKEVEYYFDGFEESVKRYYFFLKENSLITEQEKAKVSKNYYCVQYLDQLDKFNSLISDVFYPSLGKLLMDICDE